MYFGVFSFICMFTFSLWGATPIKVLYTAAIIENNYNQRKTDYLHNLQRLKKYGCEIYIVESCQKGPTYLDEYCDHVCYTQSNNPDETKSYNEATSMLIGMQHFNFDADDMILKVTGRYVLEDDRFISFVKSHIDADVIARVWNEIDAYTGYFAIKQKSFCALLDHYYDVYNTQNRFYAIEHALGNFITNQKDRLKVVELPKLYNYRSAPHRRYTQTN